MTKRTIYCVTQTCAKYFKTPIIVKTMNYYKKKDYNQKTTAFSSFKKESTEDCLRQAVTKPVDFCVSTPDETGWLSCKILEDEWLSCKILEDEWLSCKILEDEWLSCKILQDNDYLARFLQKTKDRQK